MIIPVKMPLSGSFFIARKRSDGDGAPGSMIFAGSSSAVVTVKLTTHKPC